MPTRRHCAAPLALVAVLTPLAGCCTVTLPTDAVLGLMS